MHDAALQGTFGFLRTARTFPALDKISRLTFPVHQLGDLLKVARLAANHHVIRQAMPLASGR